MLPTLSYKACKVALLHFLDRNMRHLELRRVWLQNGLFVRGHSQVIITLIWAFCGVLYIACGRDSELQQQISAAASWSQKSGSTSPERNVRWDMVTESCKPTVDGGMTVLVTGSAGFVGYHVSKALRAQGAGVLGLDNLNNYYPVVLKRARLAELEKFDVYTVEADLNDAPVIRKALDACNFTHVLHLAAQAGVRYAVKNPLSYLHSNIAGFVILLEETARTSQMPKVVFASSSSVYGLNTEAPFSENDVTDTPASLYAATKKADELLAHTYNHIHGMAITALRFFTVYGPFGRPDMAYFSFANNIARGEPVNIFLGPDGKELARDFTHISDVVNGVIASLETSEPSGKRPDGSKPQFRVFNLGNKTPVTVSDFVSMLEKHLGKKANRKYVPMPRTGDVPFTHANVSKAVLELGYDPTTTLDDGLKQFAEWYLDFCGQGKCHEIQKYKPS
jgi:UDP-glucuronate 4-epimerase